MKLLSLWRSMKRSRIVGQGVDVNSVYIVELMLSVRLFNCSTVGERVWTRVYGTVIFWSGSSNGVGL